MAAGDGRSENVGRRLGDTNWRYDVEEKSWGITKRREELGFSG